MNRLQILTVVLLMGSGTVSAAMPTFKELDVNRDKVLTKSEIDSVLSGIDFAEADKNGDGVINADEYIALVKSLKQVKG